MTERAETTRHGSGEAVEQFVSELLRWATRPENARAMRAADVDLSATDRWLMRHLDDTGPVRISELADFHGVDRSTMTTHVRRLEDRGWLDRRMDPADRRAFLVSLTAEGERLNRANVRRAGEVLDSLVADWPPAERETLGVLLTRLTERLRDPDRVQQRT